MSEFGDGFDSHDDDLGPFDGDASGPHEDDRLSAFLDDELDEDEALAVTRHLAVCDRCLDELNGIRMLRGTLRALPPIEPPPGLYGDVASKLHPLSGARGRRSVRLTAAAAASAALLGVVVFLTGDETGGTVAPPVDVYVVDHVARAGQGPLPVTVDVGR
jgi:anti-sigma factor RsiW